MIFRNLTFAICAGLIGIAALPFSASAAPGAGLATLDVQSGAVETVGFFRRNEAYTVDEDGEHVRAPATDVDVEDGNGTRVRAPFADVDTRDGNVRVRAPFVNLFLPKRQYD